MTKHGRTLVVGDIHGAWEGLKQVLGRVTLTHNDVLIFLGDYVDGWPDSAQVVSQLIALSKSNSCTFLRGNHDIWCCSWLTNGLTNEEWLANKGDRTVLSYSLINAEERTRHQAFFDGLLDYYIDEEQRLFVHAGFTSQKGPEHEPFIYNLHNDRTLLETALAMNGDMPSTSKFYPKRLSLFKEIFIGHTPSTKYGIDTPIHAGNLWDMDTGASYNGRITVMDIGTKEFWQSDPIENLYRT
ncbi:metallophosphoesterase [Olivibacter sp. XZL3]|uniref:metallophosphoesterase n=1 Tax=Olivibacter sp. XZL3 TaxID=1735116 RepID=UPI001064ECC0|nr:metallophosphoesterase [Olivibacter sp. XZL3]